MNSISDLVQSDDGLKLGVWKDVPIQIQIKTILMLHFLEEEIKNKVTVSLTRREEEILRWAAFFLHIGSCRATKTSK